MSSSLRHVSACRLLAYNSLSALFILLFVNNLCKLSLFIAGQLISDNCS